VRQKRRDWEQCLPGLDLNKLVFFDESGVNTLMARTRVADHPKGKGWSILLPPGVTQR
jgi:3-methyladenine DNA glycosylase Tag